MTVSLAGTIDYRGQPLNWRLAPCLAQLALQVGAAWPGATIYSIGDTSHAAQGLATFDGITGRATGGTDHMPDALGRVCAIDVMHESAPGLDAHALFDTLRTWAHPALDYLELENVVAGHKIEAARDHGFVPADVGSSSAGAHLHVSALHLPGQADDRSPWTIVPPAPTPEDDMPPLWFFFNEADGTTNYTDGLTRMRLTTAQFALYKARLVVQGVDQKLLVPIQVDPATAARIPVATG